MISVEAAAAVCRFVQFGSTMALWGGCACLWLLVPSALAQSISARLQGARTVAVGLAALATFARLPIDAAQLGDGWGDAFDAMTIGAVVLHTGVGRAWIAQALLASLLAVLPALLRAVRSTRPSLTSTQRPAEMHNAFIAVTSALLLAALPFSGHASMHAGALGAAHRANDVLHLLAGGAWFGALVPVTGMLAALRDAHHRAAAAVALRRFSNAGHVAVALVIITGGLNVALVLGHWPTDLSAPYQRLLLGKLVLVAALVGLAIVNRYRFVPRLRQDAAAYGAAIRTATLVEIGLGLAVIALVSVFGLLEP